MLTINKYLLDKGERISSPSDMQKGEIYFEEFDGGCRGFFMPGPGRISKNGHLRLVGIVVYEIPQGRTKFATLDLEPHQFEEGEHGQRIYRAKKGSKIRSILEDKLPRIY